MAQPGGRIENVRRKSNAADELASSLYSSGKAGYFFSEEVKKLGLAPAKTTTFEWLELDDKVSY